MRFCNYCIKVAIDVVFRTLLTQAGPKTQVLLSSSQGRLSNCIIGFLETILENVAKLKMCRKTATSLSKVGDFRGQFRLRHFEKF